MGWFCMWLSTNPPQNKTVLSPSEIRFFFEFSAEKGKAMNKPPWYCWCFRNPVRNQLRLVVEIPFKSEETFFHQAFQVPKIRLITHLYKLYTDMPYVFGTLPTHPKIAMAGFPYGNSSTYLGWIGWDRPCWLLQNRCLILLMEQIRLTSWGW